MFRDVYSLMGMMFILIITGFWLRKKEIVTREGKKCLTDLILYVVLPCNIIKAFSVELEDNIWEKCFVVLIVAITIQILSMIIARTMFNTMEEGEKAVFQYGSVCSNSGFIGNPLAEGIFGMTGLLYASVFLIPQRIVMWTAGVSYFQKGVDKKAVYKKVLMHPCMIATYIGMFILFFHIPVAGVVNRTIVCFSNCCTAMTMMYVGTILNDINLKELIQKKQFYFATIRLVMIPLIIYIFGKIINIDALALGVCTLLSATPAGSTTSLLAAKYHADEKAAATCVVFTTALSTITIPVWSFFLIHNLGL